MAENIPITNYFRLCSKTLLEVRSGTARSVLPKGRGAGMAGEQILVVDDNDLNLALMRDLLEGEGYRVRVAIDANDAIAVLHDFRPRLIFMDIQLPGMDGLTLTRMLKANPSMRDIRIVGLTAYGMVGDEERMRAAGCDGYLAKPFDTRRLPGVVSSLLQPATPHT
jgi:two-component system, cell cycle response regulator DivK